MDVHELFLSSRKGKLEKVKYLFEKKDVDLNVRDEFDGTPLYYACLCGHMDLVDYLLANGARCDTNTFEAERCHFAALTNDIRRKLRTFKITEANRLVSRNLFEEFLRKSFECGHYSDFNFKVHGKRQSVHRGILAARSPYFSDAFHVKWKSQHSAEINNVQVDPDAFKAVVHFLYTGRLNAPASILDDCIRLAEQFQLPQLEQLLEAEKKMLTSTERRRPGSGSKTVSITGEELGTALKRDLAVLAEQALPAEFRQTVLPGDLPPSVSYFPDVCFVLDKIKFHCHKVFFAGRSEYFAGMFRDHFGEANHEQDDVDSVTIHDVTPQVFAQVVHYVYYDSVKLTNDAAFEVMEAGEMYLMFGLKKLSSEYLAETANSENVVNLIRISRTFNTPSLEDSCLAYISGHLEEVIDSEDFHDLVREDAAQVKGRQETDSIPIIDDLRFLVSRKELLESHKRLHMIDNLLDKLGLEA